MQNAPNAHRSFKKSPYLSVGEIFRMKVELHAERMRECNGTGGRDDAGVISMRPRKDSDEYTEREKSLVPSFKLNCRLFPVVTKLGACTYTFMRACTQRREGGARMW